ncbi:MAG: hypothetical protein ACRC7N_09650 [Clostridium sp.]
MTIGNCNSVNVIIPNCAISPTSQNWKHTIINEKLELPINMPEIKNIQSVSASIKITNSNIILTPDSLDTLNAEGTNLTGLKLLVSGVVDEVINYESVDTCKNYSFNHSEPFTTFIVLDPGFDINAPYCLKGCLEGMMVNKLNCRSIQKNIAIFVAVN